MAYHTVLASDTQVKMMPYGLDNLVPIDEATRASVYELAQGGGGGVNHGTNKEWGVGELEFEALMRKLDNMGYRSGYHRSGHSASRCRLWQQYHWPDR